jgi:hypothetical protein
MQDIATPHTGKETVRALRGVFGEIIGRVDFIKK